MKRIIIIAISIGFSTAAMFAGIDKNEIINQAKKATATADSLYNAGNSKKAITVMENFLSYFYSLPEELQKSMQYIPAWRNFYLARYHASENNKDKSLDCFTKAMKLGLTNDKNAYLSARYDKIFDIIRNEPQFCEYYEIMDDKFSFRSILRRCGEYAPDSLNFYVKYASPDDSSLVKLRNRFNLDSVAGNGDELSKIKNLLHFVHELIRHDGSSEWEVKNPENTIEFVELCRQHNIGANCRKLAILLNECYLSMGIKSRYITCMPKTYISDCHVINSVWSNQLGKWIWADPTYDAFIMDENDNLLSIAEVRERIRTKQPLKINDYANWNHKFPATKSQYIDFYMAKNLYFIETCTYYGADMETGNTHPNKYITLAPSGYETDSEVKFSDPSRIHCTTSDLRFWESPK